MSRIKSPATHSSPLWMRIQDLGWEHADDHPGEIALYRCFDSDQVLLYVGISNNVRSRLSAHGAYRNRSAWWLDVEWITVEFFPDGGSAAKAEMHAIKTERPLWNKQGRTHCPHCRKPLDRREEW